MVSTKKEKMCCPQPSLPRAEVEELQGMDAATVFEEGRGDSGSSCINIVETVVRPYFRDDCHAVYVILGGALAGAYIVLPDNSGALHIPAVTESISISIFSNSYSIASTGYGTLEGSPPQDTREVLVLINAVKYSSPVIVAINVTASGRIARVWVYDRAAIRHV